MNPIHTATTKAGPKPKASMLQIPNRKLPCCSCSKGGGDARVGPPHPGPKGGRHDMGIPHPAHPSDSPHSSIGLSKAASGDPRTTGTRRSAEAIPSVAAPKARPGSHPPQTPAPRSLLSAAWDPKERAAVWPLQPKPKGGCGCRTLVADARADASPGLTNQINPTK